MPPPFPVITWANYIILLLQVRYLDFMPDFYRLIYVCFISDINESVEKGGCNWKLEMRMRTSEI